MAEIKIINKLNDLDFSPGIRAEYINENFQLVKRWIDSERLRVGGWGVVEGFNLSDMLPNFDILISEGIMINENGEEAKVPEHTIHVGRPVYYNMSEELTVNENGTLKLRFAPYSNKNLGTIVYDPPEHNKIDDEEFSIFNMDKNTGLTLKDIKFIDQNVIILNPELAGIKVRVDYLYANDRIDGILLKKDGSEYIYEKGIISTSPSQQVIQDYLENGYYLIGFAYWYIGKEIDVEFITVDRTYRPVYVDGENKLYLNGKLYVGNKFIIFAEEPPKFPEFNDLWYDLVNDILYVWRPGKDGKGKWVAINDLSRVETEYGIFYPEDNPEDLATFSFKTKPNLVFTPGKHQLKVVVDQIVLMQDQFEELYSEEETLTGWGIKLKNPLDKPSTLEVYVTRNVKTRSQDFDDSSIITPQTVIFADERSEYLTKDINMNDVYTLGNDYQIGNGQLEIWYGGLKLNKNKEFSEATRAGKAATHEDVDEYSNKIVFNKSLKNGGVLTYKILRTATSYSNLKYILDDINEKINSRLEKLDEAEERFNELIEGIEFSFDEINEKIQSIESSVTDLDEKKLTKTDGISLPILNKDVKERMVGGQKTVYALPEEEVQVKGILKKDFNLIFWILEEQRILLMEDTDYTITNLEDESGVLVSLDSKWVVDGAQLLIRSLMIGV